MEMTYTKAVTKAMRIYAGVYPGFTPKSLPAIPGLDGVGRVEESGPGTSGQFSPGQRVVAVPWGTKTGNGSWQQYATVPEKSLFPVLDGISDEEACQFLVNPITAQVIVPLAPAWR